jgi:hypothetical protein
MGWCGPASPSRPPQRQRVEPTTPMPEEGGRSVQQLEMQKQEHGTASYLICYSHRR